MDNIKEIWQETVKKIEAEIGKESADLWIRPTKPLFIENDTLKLEVPDSIIYETVKNRYEEKISRTIEELTGKKLKINYSMSLAASEYRPAPKIVEVRTEPIAVNSIFNPHYTFETFIVGASNRFAYASAEAVAQTPGQTNPFFIYSAPGLGKTHLLHAIAHGILKKNHSAKILYTASENFVNEYIEAVRSNAAENFRNKYRRLDCLLLDDIQFLVDKERSEEEFFYTFNSLFESKKQIVVTSDRSPRELPLSQRLVSRFLSGVVADIKMPDIETRIAILRQKKELHQFTIPDDVISFIAENVKKNIRELEGCLITVGNYCANLKIQPSIDAIRDKIKDYITSADQEENNKITIETIKTVIAEEFNIDPKDFRSQKRTESIAYPRQIAMYLACELTDMSLPNIGDEFGKDHTTVIYARDKIRQKIHGDAYFNAHINKLISKIKAVNNSNKP